MKPSSQSSGDLLADRRFAYAETLLAEGDAEAAADLLKQTLERVPAWVPAWMMLAHAEERRGRLEAATGAFRQAATLDPSGIFGATLHLARLHGGTIEADLSDAYVTALFDDYAPRFERHLIDTLGYDGPALILAALDQTAASRRFSAALDLGCGSGLMGRTIRPRVDLVDGLDLSPAMVALATATGAYRQVVAESVEAGLRRRAAGSYDLVLAADVFVYVGALDRVVADIARVLTGGGLLAFSIEESHGDAIRLNDSLRYAHSRVYVADVLAGAGLALDTMQAAAIRREHGVGSPGLVVVAHKD
ncbi:class I SAM-dependent DNA methyltransferase [Lichenihabitans psoromatis]|uniref:class I SAM-dependent DNA methyltransferase n=1 Tax=Lichenihabitans psoromatis TaxID=2528642 RepID=UPI001FDEB77E|nr:methyltransferase domain-containing protein [Lichenihabitans psoromatis]